MDEGRCTCGVHNAPITRIPNPNRRWIEKNGYTEGLRGSRVTTTSSAWTGLEANEKKHKSCRETPRFASAYGDGGDDSCRLQSALRWAPSPAAGTYVCSTCYSQGAAARCMVWQSCGPLSHIFPQSPHTTLNLHCTINCAMHECAQWRTAVDSQSE